MQHLSSLPFSSLYAGLLLNYGVSPPPLLNPFYPRRRSGDNGQGGEKAKKKGKGEEACGKTQRFIDSLFTCSPSMWRATTGVGRVVCCLVRRKRLMYGTTQGFHSGPWSATGCLNSSAALDWTHLGQGVLTLLWDLIGFIWHRW